MDIVLVNPYFHPDKGRSRVWLFPPLGLGYLAAALEREGISSVIVDGTFLGMDGVIESILAQKPKMVGITCNVVTKRAALEIARKLRGAAFLVAGGPCPSIEPEAFLSDFDAVAVGEGERTFVELVKARLSGAPIDRIDGLARKAGERVVISPGRGLMADADEAGFPLRRLFDNRKYQEYWRGRFGYACTPILTSRGCQFDCKFCSKPIFGNTYRERKPEHVIQEMKEAAALGYERIWFADDLFTSNGARVERLCRLILREGLKIGWDCLCRTDLEDAGLLRLMREAGCDRVFFGIESGSDRMLELMGKRSNVGKAARAVELAKEAGLKTGGFFMVGYPGETVESLLETVRFSNSLPLDYVSYSIAYPIQGTEFYDLVRGSLHGGEWDFEGENRLRFDSDLPEWKLRLAILKGNVLFKARKRLGKAGSVLALPFELATDAILKAIR